MAYTRSIPYTPGQKTPFDLSRSKIELFIQCKRCFWLDARLKIKRPDGPPFQINKLIDELFKKEFDSYRKNKKPHPIMLKNNVDAIPYTHKDLNKWRENFIGIRFHHKQTNINFFGAVDDIWIDAKDELIVVDYKATAKKTEVSLDADWQITYKRQLEIYQWLLKSNGFKVSPVGYFVYANGQSNFEEFNDTLHFKTKLISYEGATDWIEQVVLSIKECLEGEIPATGSSIMGGECAFCAYARDRTGLTLKYLKNNLTV
jgi:CRISPR/Cas system-associated exonuclease Cas4 (RecB family)